MATENDPSALLQYDPAAVAILADDEETLIKLKEFGKQLKRYAGMRIEMEHSKSKGEDEEEDITGEMGNGDERSQESTTVAAAARVTPSKSSTRRKRAPSITTPRKHKSVLPASVTSYGFNRPRKMARTSKKQATSSTQRKQLQNQRRGPNGTISPKTRDILWIKLFSKRPVAIVANA